MIFDESLANPTVIFTKEEYEKSFHERFIYIEELSEIERIMSQNDSYRILVLGEAGSGKTTLLHGLSYRYSYTNNTPIEYLYGCRFDHGIHEKWLENIKQVNQPIIIDGIDEMRNSNNIIPFLINISNKVICSSRLNTIYQKFFTHVIILKPSHVLLSEFAKKVVADYQQLDPILHYIISHNGMLTPRDILKYMINGVDDSNMHSFYSRYSNFLYEYGNGIDFGSRIISRSNNLILPSKEIISSVTAVDNLLLNKAKQNPNIIFELSPREFEIMVCELLTKKGYNVKLTKQTRDGGKDLIIAQTSFIGDFCIYVECKKYDATKPIGVSLVRELYGTVMADNATAGMLITTSHFTKDAREFTEKIRYRMTLKDYNDLVQTLNQIS